MLIVSIKTIELLLECTVLLLNLACNIFSENFSYTWNDTFRDLI